jgi:hypothetical protein
MSAGETDLLRRMVGEGLRPSRWSSAPHDRYAAHRHDHDKVLVAARGSIVFGLPERGTSLALAEGDRLDLPAGTLHDADVGPAGVVCLEAHLPRGSLEQEPRHIPDWGVGASRGAAGAETAPDREA